MSPLLHVGTDVHGVALAAAASTAGLLMVLAAWYARGLRRVLAHRHGRRELWRAAALVAGIGCTAVVTVPPLGSALDQRLSTHMAQHLVLIMVAAPLMALASPGHVLLAGMPPALRRRLVRGLRRVPTAGLLTPHVAWGLHVAALWLWHLPGAYDAALTSAPVHVLEHLSFLSTAWLFWWYLVAAGRRRLRGLAAAAYVALAVPPGAALGAVLTFPDHPLYPAQAARTVADGADPLLDQRIGGLIMWIPLDFVYVALAVWLFHRWLDRVDRSQSAAVGPVLPADARVPTEVGR